MVRTRSSISESELKEDYDLDLEEGVDDESEKSPAQLVRFNTSFFGADYPVETIVNRMERGEFFVPSFQRSYVWTQKQASRFVESLLYGLPVPGVFLYRESGTSGKHLIIDGQQRLKTLQFFYAGTFGEKKFRLLDVASSWNGRTYNELEEGDRLRLNDAIIHATIFKQEEPQKGDQSIYYVFERINTGGIRLSGQEIRTCIYYGRIVDVLRDLNQISEWRSVYGQPSKRLKDQELVLRFLAFFFDQKRYKRPMTGFLNQFMENNRHLDSDTADQFRRLFCSTIEFAGRWLGTKAFRPERSLNAAVFDSVMVGLATRLGRGPIRNPDSATNAYRSLLAEADYVRAYRRATADEESVSTRMRLRLRTHYVSQKVTVAAMQIAEKKVWAHRS